VLHWIECSGTHSAEHGAIIVCVKPVYWYYLRFKFTKQVDSSAGVSEKATLIASIRILLPFPVLIAPSLSPLLLPSPHCSFPLPIAPSLPPLLLAPLLAPGFVSSHYISLSHNHPPSHKLPPLFRCRHSPVSTRDLSHVFADGIDKWQRRVNMVLTIAIIIHLIPQQWMPWVFKVSIKQMQQTMSPRGCISGALQYSCLQQLAFNQHSKNIIQSRLLSTQNYQNHQKDQP
jgi:hypothetical protein